MSKKTARNSSVYKTSLSKLILLFLVLLYLTYCILFSTEIRYYSNISSFKIQLIYKYCNNIYSLKTRLKPFYLNTSV